MNKVQNKSAIDFIKNVIVYELKSYFPSTLMKILKISFSIEKPKQLLYNIDYSVVDLSVMVRFFTINLSLSERQAENAGFLSGLNPNKTK
ncbi:MAG: hypothetical protein Q4C95_09430 [Planctomycetia bacterium]|nr:hypothetical protein [Planctomycetia bacterium]